MPGPACPHHLLATDRLTSKSGAGRRAPTVFDERWHPIVNEALRVRSGAPTSPVYDAAPAARARETIAFTQMAVEACLRLNP